jgi:hypothetical protein
MGDAELLGCQIDGQQKFFPRNALLLIRRRRRRQQAE